MTCKRLVGPQKKSINCVALSKVVSAHMGHDVKNESRFKCSFYIITFTVASLENIINCLPNENNKTFENIPPWTDAQVALLLRCCLYDGVVARDNLLPPVSLPLLSINVDTRLKSRCENLKLIWDIWFSWWFCLSKVRFAALKTQRVLQVSFFFLQKIKVKDLMVHISRKTYTGIV